MNAFVLTALALRLFLYITIRNWNKPERVRSTLKDCFCLLNEKSGRDCSQPLFSFLFAIVIQQKGSCDCCTGC